jgi:cysteinyl-tRNA synthetase
LKRLFAQAVAHSWDQGKFTAELRSTRWFKQHGEAARNAMVLQKTDPGTWSQRTQEAAAQIQDMAAQMGAQLTTKSLKAIAANVITYGWNDSQIRNTLSQAVKVTAQGSFYGQAEVNAETLRQTAQNNGVRVSDTTLRSWVQRIAAGEPVEGFETYVRNMAAGAFPAWADQVKAGHDIKDLASPYMEQMAKTLEMNVNDIDLFDPTIRKTLQATDDKGAPVSKPMYAFEQSLKQDKRWRYTDGARNELDAVGRGVLKDFGLVS